MFKDHKNTDVLFFSMKIDYLKKFHEKLEKIKMQNLQGKTWTKGSQRMVMLLTYLMNYSMIMNHIKQNFWMRKK